MCVFYFLSYCILTLRLIECIDYIRYNARAMHDHYPLGGKTGLVVGDECDVTATYCKVMLGYFTCASILEMVITMRQGEVRYNAGDFTDEYARKLRVRVYIFAFSMSFLVLILLGFALYYQTLYDRTEVFRDYYGKTTCIVFTILLFFLLLSYISFIIMKRRSFSK